MISKGNHHAKFAGFVLLAISEEAKNMNSIFCSIYNNTMIIIAFAFIFVIPRIIQVKIIPTST